MEPATGNRCPGQPGRAAINSSPGIWILTLQTADHSNVPTFVGANAAPPHSRERECGCVIPEDARSQDGKNWHVLVTFQYNTGSCAVPSPANGNGLRDQRLGEWVTPRRPLSGRGNRAQGCFGSQTEAVRSAILPFRARSPSQNREGHESHRVGNAAVGR